MRGIDLDSFSQHCGAIRLDDRSRRCKVSGVVARLRFVVAIVLFFIVGNTSLLSQQVSDRYAQIPGDSLSITSIDFETIRNLKELEMVPWEILAAFGKQELGIDPMLISTIDFTSGLPSLNGPEFGVVIKTKAPVDIAQLNGRLFSDMTRAPKNQNMKVRSLNDAPAKVVQLEPLTVMVGSEGTLRRMLAGKVQTSKTIELIGKSKYPVRSITAIEPLRPIIEGALADASGAIPPQFLSDLQVVADELSYIQTESSVGLSAEVVLKLGARDKDSIERLVISLERLRKNGLVFAEAMVNQQIQNDRQMTPEVKTAALQYVQRMKGFLATADLWNVVGDEIVMDGRVAYSVPTIGVLVGLLLPAVQAAREAARRMSSQNNMKQIMLAMLNHESAFKQFPARATRDADGKPLLSWRVKILPFLEENGLYQEFHQDEPWDSEHNIKLLERMPAVYKHPSYVGAEGHTVYLVPYQKGNVWTSAKPQIRNITDGTSNTIACFETNDEHAVPWSKPDDIDLDQDDIFDFFRFGVSNVGMFDGSVRAIAPSIDPVVLKAMITSAGGEVVQLS